MSLTELQLPYGTFLCEPTDYFNEEVQQTGFWDHDLRVPLDSVPAGSFVVDVGAHIGLYAGYLASRGCVVTAFEGHPLYVPRLAYNLANNPRWPGQADYIPSFIYSHACLMGEHRQHDTRASNTWLPDVAGTVPALPLDLAIPLALPVRLLKIDAQGADLHVLLGAERLIAQHHPDILIEFEHPLAALHGHGPEDYHGWRDAHGYTQQDVNGWNAWWQWKGAR